MAGSHHSHTPCRRRVGDRANTSAATPPDADHTPDNPNEHTPGRPNARGTLPMACHLTDPAIEEEIQALARTAPTMTAGKAIRIARLLRWNERQRADHAA